MALQLVKGINIRSEILQFSLMIEHMTSAFLGNLLNIKNFIGEWCSQHQDDHLVMLQ